MTTDSIVALLAQFSECTLALRAGGGAEDGRMNQLRELSIELQRSMGPERELARRFHLSSAERDIVRVLAGRKSPRRRARHSLL